MINDRISDMIARINNALASQQKPEFVVMPKNNILAKILDVLTDEGYIYGFEEVVDAKGHPMLKVSLKYHNGRPVISGFKRCSKLGKRQYDKVKTLKKCCNGLGIYILTTSKGVMTDHNARKQRVGGELLCYVF